MFEDDNVCNDCKFCLNKCDEKPCSTCMQWVDGYLDATNYGCKEYV